MPLERVVLLCPFSCQAMSQLEWVLEQVRFFGVAGTIDNDNESLRTGKSSASWVEISLKVGNLRTRVQTHWTFQNPRCKHLPLPKRRPLR
jgi:hypothetical protein